MEALVEVTNPDNPRPLLVPSHKIATATDTTVVMPVSYHLIIYDKHLLDEDLEEPFSDTDDETVRRRQPEKPNLFIPRGRIRTLSGTVSL